MDSLLKGLPVEGRTNLPLEEIVNHTRSRIGHITDAGIIWVAKP